MRVYRFKKTSDAVKQDELPDGVVSVAVSIDVLEGIDLKLKGCAWGVSAVWTIRAWSCAVYRECQQLTGMRSPLSLQLLLHRGDLLSECLQHLILACLPHMLASSAG